jgi:predicted ATPase/DNA-binding winged helix-turn-helix (wHTH) protein
VDSKRATSGRPDRVLRFGPFMLLPSPPMLLEGEHALHVSDRALDILMMLLQRPGQVVSKEELIAHAWPGAVVDAINLRVHIAALRKVLRDGKPPRFIVNVVGQGYVFVADVHSDDECSPAIAQIFKGSRIHHLPAPLMPLIGRDAELTALIDVLRAHRLVTIVGAGGVGKTTLATEVAVRLREHYAHGAHLIDLSSLDDGALIADSFAVGLELAISSQPALAELTAYLRSKEVLLVVDNCEHVIEAAAKITMEILEESPGTRVLATSREPLGTPNEWLYRLLPLECPAPDAGLTASSAQRYAAVRLFKQRAETSASTFALSDSNVAAISRICRELDGNPMAIELAAARVSLLGSHQLAGRLGEHFLAITNPRRAAAPRQHTLHATLDWSYARLGLTAQITLQRLAIFNSPFTEEAAAAVAAYRDLGVPDVVLAVRSLASKSLLAMDTRDPPARYRLPHTTRVYALRKLSKSGEYLDVSRRHCEYVRKLLRSLETHWPLTSPGWIKEFDLAVGDVRAALDWAFSSTGDPLLGVEITIASVPFASELGLVDEFRIRAKQAWMCLERLSNREAEAEPHLRATLTSMVPTPRNDQPESRPVPPSSFGNDGLGE